MTILAGGDREDFDACLSILQAMGKNIDYEGKAGNGQHTKMCNQIAVAGALAGACEAMVYAKNVGLDVDTMLKSISTGAASSVQMNNVVQGRCRTTIGWILHQAFYQGYEPGR